MMKNEKTWRADRLWSAQFETPLVEGPTSIQTGAATESRPYNRFNPYK